MSWSNTGKHLLDNTGRPHISTVKVSMGPSVESAVDNKMGDFSSPASGAGALCMSTLLGNKPAKERGEELLC